MTIPRSVQDVLEDHVTLETECIDRMYLNLYVPYLQSEGGVAQFWRRHRGHTFASSALMQPMSQAFISSIEDFCKREGVDLIRFRKGQRKDDVAQEYLREFPGEEGVLFVGKAQEKVSVVRTIRRRNPKTGQSYPWLQRSTAMVNQYYFYCVDRDFGPFFLKLGSYFPYNGKLCINGHEYLKRQLSQRNIDYEALDNGILSCAQPKLMQRLSRGLSAKKIDALARKWFRLLPHPFSRNDRRAGYRYDVSILQAEFSLTQVLDRPLSGRIFFEQVIRDHLDLGRPDQVQLIFTRRVTRRTPGRFRTRVLTQGVIPSLHVDYKHCRIKQYFKEGRALRTETIINNTRDFEIGRRLHNLAALRQVGFQANRRLLSIQKMDHDVLQGEAVFEQVHRPVQVGEQRAPALRFPDPRVHALLSALTAFHVRPRGFRNSDLREHMAQLLVSKPGPLSRGSVTYDLRRLRLHGLIERIKGTHRYRVTSFGHRAAYFLIRVHPRVVCAGLAGLSEEDQAPTSALASAYASVDKEIDALWRQAATP